MLGLHVVIPPPLPWEHFTLPAASLSGTLLQTLPDLVTYATERALFIAAQLFTDVVNALRKSQVLRRLWKQPTLRAPLSGTFLQTLPDLVTPLKGTLYLHAAAQRHGQRPLKGSGTNMTVEAT